jgi:hypothetical protein
MSGLLEGRLGGKDSNLTTVGSIICPFKESCKVIKELQIQENDKRF